MTSQDHGGLRRGAGRKPGSNAYGEPTQPLRVPVSQVETVVAFLDAHRQPATAENPRPMSLTPTTVALTTFVSRVPAGFPSPAADYLDDSIDLNAELIIHGHEAATFVIRVKGWSMMQAGIFEGDRIIVDRALTARQGDVVVAITSNGSDLTIKRLGMLDGKVALLPENPHFKPITFEEGDTLEIWGVVTNCLRNFRRGGR